MVTVFVTDAQKRRALAVIRSLARQGIRVIAGETSGWALSFFSKYCADSVTYPCPRRNGQHFIEWLLGHVAECQYDVIFPISEEIIGLVAEHKAELSRHTIVPVVDHEVYMQARNKAETIKVALEHGIPCPETHFVTELEEVDFLAEHIEYPAVIKPRESSGSRGLVYVRSEDELRAEYRRVHVDYAFPIVQEFIPPGGGTFGVNVLCNAWSEPRAVFVHKRLREYPISGGPSTLRESVYYPSLAELGIRLLKALNWYGVAMVEFKVDPRDGQPKLMEVNPKIWGSIQLALDAGVDFPYLWYKVAVEGDIEPVNEYKVGHRCRWLPGDILNFFTNPNRFRSEPSFFQFWDENLSYDVLSRDDPAPILGFFLSYLVRIDEIWKRDITRR